MIFYWYVRFPLKVAKFQIMTFKILLIHENDWLICTLYYKSSFDCLHTTNNFHYLWPCFCWGNKVLGAFVKDLRKMGIAGVVKKKQSWKGRWKNYLTAANLDWLAAWILPSHGTAWFYLCLFFGRLMWKPLAVNTIYAISTKNATRSWILWIEQPGSFPFRLRVSLQKMNQMWRFLLSQHLKDVQKAQEFLGPSQPNIRCSLS